jgi:glycosyltransferase involved in cell wall biosynthesis
VDVVIPALDEEAALGGVIDSLPREGSGWSVRRVCVADNGSTDGTARVAERHGARVVSEPRRGYGAACLAALHSLRADPPEVVLFVDADGSDDPADVPSVLAPVIDRVADLAVGSRALGKSERGALTPVQAFGNRLAAVLMRACFGANVTDLGPLRAIRWDALVGLRMRDRDFGWTVEMQTRAFRAGLRYREVPVRYRRRLEGRSKVAGTWSGAAAAGAKILFTIAKVRLGG